jgi:hypothetical protein
MKLKTSEPRIYANLHEWARNRQLRATLKRTALSRAQFAGTANNRVICEIRAKKIPWHLLKSYNREPFFRNGSRTLHSIYIEIMAQFCIVSRCFADILCIIEASIQDFRQGDRCDSGFTTGS